MRICTGGESSPKSLVGSEPMGDALDRDRQRGGESDLQQERGGRVSLGQCRPGSVQKGWGGQRRSTAVRTAESAASRVRHRELQARLRQPRGPRPPPSCCSAGPGLLSRHRLPPPPLSARRPLARERGRLPHRYKGPGDTGGRHCCSHPSGQTWVTWSHPARL